MSVLMGREVGGVGAVVGGRGGHSSLLAIHGDKLYAFHPAHNAILITNFRHFAVSGPNDLLLPDQELKLTNRIPFQVSQLALRPRSGDSCILVGQRGIASFGFENVASGNGHINYEVIIGNQLYIDHPSLEVFQCKWLPTLAHNVIVVLNSDYYLRVYNAESNECLRVFCLGPSNSLPLVVKYNAEIDPEMPVDFDFGLYFPKSKSWSIFALTASGTVSCTVLRLIGTSLRCLIETYGPLHRILDDDDSRVEDGFSCILSSRQYPVVIVTGQDSGQITHSVLLPIEVGEDELEEENMEDKLQKNEIVLHTKERLNLNLSENASRSPMKLLADPLYDERYVCIHGGGVHLVVMKFLSEMLNFFNAEETNSLSNLSPSVCRLLLDWRFGVHEAMANKLLGVTYSILQPQKLLFALEDKRSILYTLPHPDDLFHTNTDHRDRKGLKTSSNTSNVFGQKNVINSARNLLRNSACQPFLCADGDIPVSQRVKIASTAIKVKSEQMEGLDEASQYVLGYITGTLEAKTEEMKKLLKDVLDNRADLKVAAERIAEKYEERKERDEALTKRLESLLFQYHQSFSIITDQEKIWTKAMDEMKQDTTELKDTLRRLVSKLPQVETTDLTLQANLTALQIKQIKEEISSQYKLLTGMISNLREIHHKLSLS